MSTLLLGPVLLAAYPLRFETRYALANLWVRFNMWMLETVCGLKYEVHGLENIPERSGIILCKHQSAWETLALQAIFPPLVFILKRELLRIPVWGWAMATLEPIAIDRQAKSAAMKQILKDGEERLKSGRWVVIFPEGTRVAPGQKGRYGASGGILAHRVGCPVVPVAHNAGEYWTRNGFLKFPGLVQVRIGPPIDSTTLNSSEINHQAEHWIESQMAEISGFGPYARTLSSSNAPTVLQ
ncbi:lysophospholipid acyltransferase family protein [Methylocaldum sp.]|uniref:lysophospholipid acyltransferase family protein n=1 Tax=Methylocaldum sp. TaxID=1969727 RepID=UPI002D554955|nr:lysophospholipid acyltransferase family protein [Methylocaldum sp.]HYE35363.1 lysophospholipid acyltransferase family protein [Methylocaldum sp.]